MAKQRSLVDLAEEISALSPNELQTLGKIVIAKQQMTTPAAPVSAPQNVPGPMGSATPQMQQRLQQPRRTAPPTARDVVMPGLLR
ncbi:MAG TPA: hypothetical protein DCM10_19240 [Xanthomarina gelatinilytica]|nr:hypothetical protein [Xanthomarina gelatinilytica]